MKLIDLQRPTVSLWKDLNLLNIHNFNSEDKKDFECRFDRSKWPHLHRTYLLGVWHSFSVTVWYILHVSINSQTADKGVLYSDCGGGTLCVSPCEKMHQFPQYTTFYKVRKTLRLCIAYWGILCLFLYQLHTFVKGILLK